MGGVTLDWKKLLINAGLAGGWYVLGQLEVLDAQWAFITVVALRTALGWLAARFGKAVPVDV